MVEDGETREQPLLISPCDRLSSEELSDTCRLGSVNDGLCRKRIEYHNHNNIIMVMGRQVHISYLVRGRHNSVSSQVRVITYIC